jgi:hypothetical protein
MISAPRPAPPLDHIESAARGGGDFAFGRHACCPRRPRLSRGTRARRQRARACLVQFVSRGALPAARLCWDSVLLWWLPKGFDPCARPQRLSSTPFGCTTQRMGPLDHHIGALIKSAWSARDLHQLVFSRARLVACARMAVVRRPVQPSDRSAKASIHCWDVQQWMHIFAAQRDVVATRRHHRVGASEAASARRWRGGRTSARCRA